MTNTSGSMWLSVEAPGVRAPWGFPCVWLFPVAHRCRIPCRPSLACVVLLAIALVERGVFMAGVEGLWSVDADGLVSVADDGVLRGVVQDAARRGSVSDVFVDSCVELFFRVLRARGCVMNDDAVRLALSGAAGELVCAVLPGERALASLDVGVLTAGLARVGDIVCGAAISVAASDDVEREALRLAESARLIAAASGDLP